MSDHIELLAQLQDGYTKHSQKLRDAAAKAIRALAAQVKLLTFEPVLEKLQAQNEALKEQVKEYNQFLINLTHRTYDTTDANDLLDLIDSGRTRIKAMGDKND